MSDSEPPVEPVHVPPDALSAEALRGVIESFVLREGTDYGERECRFEDKCAQVLAQVRRGEVCILYDPKTESVTLAVTAGAARRARPE
jgi:uncharacterized protein YheU (UPF0270 family)